MDKNRFIPDWRETPPPEKSYRSIFKLGKKDEFKHPSDAWYDMIKKEFGLSDGDFRIKQKEGNEVVILDKKSGLSEKQIEKFSEITGKDNIS
ncbi:MAG: FAD-binding oxidoreductase, partial [Deltaproteobacteria bacterium]|nr:FAD-binding oxidoreductase [Deltaproteobacteria bacterium]